MKKPLYPLLGILLLFVVIYLILIQKEKKTFSPAKVADFLELDSASVDGIEFRKLGTRLLFQRSKQRWYVVEPDSFRADKSAVGKLLNAASHLEVGELISSNKAKQLVFQVDTLTGTRLDFFAGENRVASVVVGKMSSDFLHSYLRKTDSDDVYLAEGQFGQMATRSVNRWRDRSIFTFDPKQIKEIELNTSEQKLKLAEEDTLWLLSRYPYEESIPADRQAVQDYIATLASIRADEFPRSPATKQVDFSRPQLVVKLAFTDGHEERMVAVRTEKESNRYFVKTDQDRNVFILFEYNFNRLARRFEDFQPKEEA